MVGEIHHGCSAPFNFYPMLQESERIFYFPSLSTLSSIFGNNNWLLWFHLRPWHLTCKQSLHKPRHAIGSERFKGHRGDVMKNKLMGKLFRILGDKLFPLLIQRFRDMPNFAETKRHKKVSPERDDLPEFLQFLKNRVGQTALKRH